MEDLVVAEMEHETLAESFAQSFSGRRVFVTGHNGFVGSWLSLWLVHSGASVVGCSLPRPSDIGVMPAVDSAVETHELDIRDAASLEALVTRSAPEVVFHLAAQPLVFASYEDPLGTLETNVIGTAHLLEVARRISTVRAVVVVTSDKCYATGPDAHTEQDPLGGDDPYSSSKAAAELVTNSFRRSFFAPRDVGVATARAGNIMGGGDWSRNRIIPDCARAMQSGTSVRLRHPEAVRPWQHVLDATAGFLQLAAALLSNPGRFAEPWNFGPPPEAAATVGEVVRFLLERWRIAGMKIPDPVVDPSSLLAERERLTLSSDKAGAALGWSPRFNLEETIAWTADWYGLAIGSEFDPTMFTIEQITRYLERASRTPPTSRL